MSYEHGGFQGGKAFLSNFYLAEIMAMGKKWRSSEHLYQAMKTLDPAEREKVRFQPSPGEAKYFGQKRIAIRPDWEAIKVEVMRDVVRVKFQQNPDLAMLLVSTNDDQLIEYNWWHDNFWGICTCSACPDSGRNELGKVLMAVRSDLREAFVIRDQYNWRW